MTESWALSTENLLKEYPGVRALDQVSISFNSGEVHGLIGANGAGKSTLIKILAGAIQPDNGSVFLDGRSILPLTPAKAKQEGIQVIHQDLNLVPQLNVAQNVFLGHEIRMRCGLLSEQAMRNRTQQILDELGMPISPEDKVADLSVSYQQMVAVAAALLQEARILIVDEATAALTVEEIDHLFDRIRMLRDRGLSIVYVSHRLEEIFEICDCVSILRDGIYNGTLTCSETERNNLIERMVGDKFEEQYPKAVNTSGKELLQVQGLKLKNEGDPISFSIREGEIFGLFGLVGSGRTEIARAIFGADTYPEGEIWLRGSRLHLHRPADAVAQGIGLIPEDRKKQGLLLGMSLQKNITLPSIRSFTKSGLLNQRSEIAESQRQIEDLRIVTAGPSQEVRYLSGGNQQKVVLAKWLATQSSLLILDQPTRGIDVRAKTEIYQLMQRLAAAGHALLIISDELPEVIGMSDRIGVMFEGRLMAVLEKEKATQETLLQLACGGE
ncbi:MAG: sugar ABC transporter ATP-binding protein [Anaerolineales bacterium]|nr:sugar ABC transporter ATP-binding protein [Anaerolineales bacterium]